MKGILFGILSAGLLALSGCTILGQQIQITPVQNIPTNNGVSNPTTPAVKTSVKLDLSNQQLTKVPEYVFNMTNLEELNLSNNQLTGAIQSQIGQLKKLKVLNASNNLMTGVPAEVGQLQNLQVLDLSNNQLTGLPNELANLKNLKTFNISGNNYSTQDLNTIMKGLPASVNIIK
ncbi:MAG: leucine-rich repeat domain-containing protein [Candidatus Magasanikbacteria bacterium]|nr:leucine-rich repeat domain-containing protein [Candidatus Magasanikbacteria bacterium]